ncbi:carbohydrate esterase family 16 protein [Pleomassaria siparia CBS 279.74]|uniref:Carbohydrate esterase family 16 protein n=1 Tax=Pleomassaria siparia CBS 279.74 TaxID=1314801 RepID=A0A6G1K5E8_9PLEO|nr:carbohydrate esterase family 16 protein [Pleomassaria siparia CBS 279.74]
MVSSTHFLSLAACMFFASTVQGVAVRSSSSSSSVATARAASPGTKHLMIFGDSYSCDGFWAGSTTPSSALPLGVSLPGTTTSGGLNWVGRTATELNTSLVLAYDYAEYGATTDEDLVRGATDDVTDQVQMFMTHTASGGEWTADDTMAIVWIGINDVGNSMWDGFATPIEKIMDQYLAQLKILYDAGIRYFTLFTIPPFDQAPVMSGSTTAAMDSLRANITAYNNDLVTRMATFKAANPGVTGTVFNTSASFWAALDSPSKYGAADATCANADGTTCLWYDNYHPGQAIQKLVAENFVEALTGTFF